MIICNEHVHHKDITVINIIGLIIELVRIDLLAIALVRLFNNYSLSLNGV